MLNCHHRRLFKNHGGAVGYWEGWIEADGLVVMQHAKTLDGKAVRQEYRTEGKNIGRANETTSHMQAVSELESRTKKKLDKGYVTSLDQASEPVTNTLGFSRPMLATPLDKVNPDKIDWAHAYVQPKLDGHRCLFKDGILYSREGKVIEMPHILEAIQASGLSHLHLDGELYIHGLSLQEISRLVKKPRPETLDLLYCVFDQVSTDQFTTRRIGLSAAYEEHDSIGILQTQRVTSMDQVIEAHVAYRADGFEGTMLRYGTDGYEDNKRSRKLLKIKEFQDAEFTVIDVREGKPYIKDDGVYQLPIWICDVGNGETFDVTCQGNMHEKHEFFRNRFDYIGSKLTVQFHYFSEKGIPQLPTALRFHEVL